MSKLRILSVTVQPILVWDDGEELKPGPNVASQSLLLSGLGDFAEGLPAAISDLEVAQLS